jgi:DNA-binding PadR family transcriptional regulator
MTAPLGEFELLVLMAVLRLRDESYPPEVRAELERRTARAVSRGAVYITLERLETKGLLGSKLAAAADGGRQRRYYRVSARGLRAVNRALSALEQMREGIEPLLGKA